MFWSKTQLKRWTEIVKKEIYCETTVHDFPCKIIGHLDELLYLAHPT